MPTKQPSKDDKGFTLIELSIVLVVIGLIIGGVLVGISMIRAAELRSITVEREKFASALNVFRLQYNAIPGDMLNATNFWGQAASGSSCATSTATGTCNGNGNGAMSVLSDSVEYFRAWQHLSLAGLLESGYSGVQGASSTIHHVLGVNAPKGKVANAGWSFRTLTPQSGQTAHSDGNYGNIMYYGEVYASNSYTFGKALTPIEQWGVDQKIDDGKPGTGKIMAMWWDNCSTATSSSHLTGEYDLDLNEKQCAMVFLNAF